MASTDAKPVPLRNVALRATFGIRNASGALVTGAASLDSEVSKDGGAFADCTAEATEIGASGVYTLDLAAGEMDGQTVVVVVKSTSNPAVVLVFYPATSPGIDVNIAAVSGDTVAADNLELAYDGTGYVGGTTLQKVDVEAINAGVAAASKLRRASDGMTNGTVASGGTTTGFVSDLTEATNDHYNGKVLTFTAGALAGQSTRITDYVGGTKALVVETLTEAPANGDAFSIH